MMRKLPALLAAAAIALPALLPFAAYAEGGDTLAEGGYTAAAQATAAPESVPEIPESIVYQAYEQIAGNIRSLRGEETSV